MDDKQIIYFRYYILIIVLMQCLGCARTAFTRVYLHGDTLDSEGHIVPNALVRFGSIETVSSDQGRFGFFFQHACVKKPIGDLGYVNTEVLGLAKPYQPLRVQIELDAMSVLGSTGCSKEKNQYVKLVFEKNKN